MTLECCCKLVRNAQSEADSCLPVKGILGAVAVSRAVPLLDLGEKDKGDRQS